MTRIAYTEAIEDLRREGYSRDDIAAAFDSLCESGMQATDEDGPLGDDELTTDEVGVLRRQLEGDDDEVMVIDEDGVSATYSDPDEGAIGRECAREMGQRQIEQAKRRGEWRGNAS